MGSAAGPRPTIHILAIVALLLGLAPVVSGKEPPAPVAVRVSLEDGRTFVGTIVQDEESQLTLRTAQGVEVHIPRDTIASIGATAAPDGGFLRQDPHDSRLMFSPTGRPLPKGDGYFSDHYVLFPGLTYGITDALSVAGGVSVVPAIGIENQVFFASARLARQVSDKVALSAGALYATGGDESAAILFGVGTFGRPERSLTLGLGFGGAQQEGGYPDYRRRFQWREAPILMIGGSLQLSNSTALVSENWLLLGPEFELSQQPFGLALRIFGDRISADIGLILVGEVLQEGLPIPWLSVSYHFGPAARKRPAGQRRR